MSTQSCDAKKYKKIEGDTIGCKGCCKLNEQHYVNYVVTNEHCGIVWDNLKPNIHYVM